MRYIIALIATVNVAAAQDCPNYAALPQNMQQNVQALQQDITDVTALIAQAEAVNTPAEASVMKSRIEGLKRRQASNRLYIEVVCRTE